MSSLGFVGNSDQTIKIYKKNNISEKKSVKVEIPVEVKENRYYFIYLLTGLVHLGIAIYILTIDFVYPVTIFQTKLREDVQEYFTCVYENLGSITAGAVLQYVRGFDEAGSVLRDDLRAGLDMFRGQNVTSLDALPESLTSQLPSNFCKNIESASDDIQDVSNCQAAIVRYSSNIGDVVSQGPWIAAYELVEIVSDTMLPKMLLLFSVIITSIMDFYKAFMFRKKLMSETSDFSGIPLLWIEYAMTTALLSFFMASIAQVFDLNFLVASILSQFSLMYFGLVIDKLIDLGYTNLSLVLFWQPGMALFTITWYPIFQNIVLLKPVLCKSGVSFFCEPTCFESDYMYSIYVILSFVIFGLFPMVTVYKIKEYDGVLSKYPFLGFLLYVPYSFMLSLYYVLFGDYKLYEKKEPSERYNRRRLFIVNQVLYSILSLTSKVFISMFFIAQFATNFPWRSIQQTFS